MTASTGRPSVIFVCVFDAGRSQMAAGFTTALSGGAVEVARVEALLGELLPPGTARGAQA